MRNKFNSFEALPKPGRTLIFFFSFRSKVILKHVHVLWNLWCFSIWIKIWLIFFTNIFPEMSEVDIFILKIVTDLKKKVSMQKKARKNLKTNYRNCVAVKTPKHWYTYDATIVIVLHHRSIHIARKRSIKSTSWKKDVSLHSHKF